MKQALFAGAALVGLLATVGAPSPNPAHIVHIRMFAFTPQTLHVQAGDTVAFVNDDSDAHTVTSAAKLFDSAGLDTNDRWQHTFFQAGSYAYYCALHPYMKGTIVVSVPTGTSHS